MSSRLASLFVASARPVVLGVAVTATLLSPRPASATPSGPLIDQVAAEIEAVVDHATIVGDLSGAYAALVGKLHPDVVQATYERLFDEAFQEEFEVETSGLYSIGAGGPLDHSTYVLAETAEGGAAAISGLELIPFELADVGVGDELLLADLGIPVVQPYTYAATIGAAGPHVGYGVRLAKPSNSVFVFVPVAFVDELPISANDAAHFLQHVIRGDFNGGLSFVEFALERAGVPPTFLGPGGTGGTGGIGSGGLSSGSCDEEAVSDCMYGALDDWQSAIDAAEDDLQEEIDQILQDVEDELVTAGVIGGAVGGGISALLTGVRIGAAAGSAGGPGGTLAGAIIGGAVAAVARHVIAIGVGAGVSAAIVADAAANEIAAAREEFVDITLCVLANEWANAHLACFDLHCPEHSTEVWIGLSDLLTNMGC